MSPGRSWWRHRYVYTTLRRRCKGFNFHFHAISYKSHIHSIKMTSQLCSSNVPRKFQWSHGYVSVISPESSWWSHGYIYTRSQRRCKRFNFDIHTTSHSHRSHIHSLKSISQLRPSNVPRKFQWSHGHVSVMSPRSSWWSQGYVYTTGAGL